VPAPRAAIVPVAPEVFRLSLTMSAETRAGWQRLRELVGADDTAVLARAVTAAVKALEAQKLGATDAPRAARSAALESRHVPSAVKREVVARDGNQCAFASTAGRRCSERRWLQFHHVKPWMAGGPTTVENIQLRCRAHNQHEADVFYRRPPDVLEQRTTGAPSPDGCGSASVSP
jgi:hypothetical protein